MLQESAMRFSLDFKNGDDKRLTRLYKHINREKYIPKDPNEIDGIDPSKVKFDINLVEKVNRKKYEDAIFEKHKENKIVGFQKKSTKYTCWVAHAGNIDNQLPKEDAIKYLTELAQWIGKNFGDVMIASIHLSEATPHLHIITSNYKNFGEKAYWSTKAAFGYIGLSQKEIEEKAAQIGQMAWEEVGKKYGFVKPERNSDTIGFKKQIDYKVHTAKKRLQNAEKYLAIAKEENNKIVNGILETIYENIQIISSCVEKLTNELTYSKEKSEGILKSLNKFAYEADEIWDYYENEYNDEAINEVKTLFNVVCEFANNNVENAQIRSSYDRI